LVAALILAVVAAGALGVLRAGDPSRHPSGSTPSRTPTPTRALKHSPTPPPKPGARPTPKPAARAKLTGTGSRRSAPIVLAGDYVLRDSIATLPGCHWRVFIDGYDNAPMDEVLTNATGSTSNEIPLIALDVRRYTLRVVSSSCGHWSVTLTRT
jgi:hypothetical protein